MRSLELLVARVFIVLSWVFLLPLMALFLAGELAWVVLVFLGMGLGKAGSVLSSRVSFLARSFVHDWRDAR